MEIDFLNSLIERYQNPQTEIYIADSYSRILAATDASRIGGVGNTASYILTIRHSASIRSDSAPDSTIHYGNPVIINEKVEFVVVTYGSSDAVNQTGNTIHAALLAAVEYQEYKQQKDKTASERRDEIAALLLSEKAEKDRLLSLMYQHELNPDLYRTVIQIQLDFYRNSFFNINLDIGSESAIESLRAEIARSLRHSRFLNSQDLLYVHDRNTILIIKSFIGSKDISRLYFAIDEVCKDFEQILKQYQGLSFFIAYGNCYNQINEIRNSWNEASEMLKLGRIYGKQDFYNLDSLLLESVSLHLPIQIENKYLIPAVEKLTAPDGSLMAELLDNAEAFIDNCLSLTITSQTTGIHRNTIKSRLQRFAELTGLNPLIRFQDSFLIKMLSLYVKRIQNPESV